MPDDVPYASRIMAALGAGPDRPLLWWRGRRISAGEFRRMTVSAAATLRELGIGRGRTVAVLTESNAPDMLVARYAANLTGATVTHLRSTNAASGRVALALESQLAMVTEAGVDLLVLDASTADRAGRLRELSPRPLALAAAGPVDADAHDLLAAGVTEFEPPPIDPEDLAVITYTSGSTGRPKGICRSFRAWSHAISTTTDDGVPPRLLVTTPLSHTVGPFADAALLSGGSLVLHQGFAADEVLRAVGEHGITRLFVAPPQLYRLLGSPAPGAGTLRQILYGGTPASPARLAEAVRTFGPILVQTYGTTETWEICGLTAEDHLVPERLGTAGRPSPGIDVTLLDPATGAAVPTGEIGEVCVRSPGMLNGYWKDPDLTATTLRGGWFHTGDLGFFDTSGYLHLVDRLAHVIKHGGVKVYPVEVENVLLRHPAVAQAAVFGVRDRDEVEHVHAAVVLVPGGQATEGELRGLTAEHLSPLHAPEVLTLRAELPQISSGKIDKQSLKQEALMATGRDITVSSADYLRLLIHGTTAFELLRTALEFDLFERLETSGGLDVDGVARELGVAPQPARILLLGLSSLHLLEKRDGVYVNGELVRRKLLRSGERYLGPLVEIQAEIINPALADFAESMRRDTNVGLRSLDGPGDTLYERLTAHPGKQRVFYANMGDASHHAFAQILDHYDFSALRHVIDLGGGDGTNAFELARRYPGLEVTVFDQESVTRLAADRVDDPDLRKRVHFRSGDLFTDPLPEGADGVLFFHIFEIWSLARNTELLRRCRDALEPGGVCLVYNFVSNDEGTGSMSAGLVSPYFLTLASGEGMTYSAADMERAVLAAGFGRAERHQDLGFSHALVIGHK